MIPIQVPEGYEFTNIDKTHAWFTDKINVYGGWISIKLPTCPDCSSGFKLCERCTPNHVEICPTCLGKPPEVVECDECLRGYLKDKEDKYQYYCNACQKITKDRWYMNPAKFICDCGNSYPQLIFKCPKCKGGRYLFRWGE